ncbi:cytochrome b-c1 complex subunit 8 [Andrena cerasifolii]|uniref:cytochrome b-c1 complex subunit 8 n=1 Tax=Andrena cerasifolii TaxID=2819439 RepID=UPI0040383506
MGLEFGELPVRIRRVVYYTLTAMEQKFWVKSVSHGIPNMFRRAVQALPTMAPGIIMTVGTMAWSTAANRKSKRKDPKLYENDT